MINLDQISDKIKRILNGTDQECLGISKDASLDFSFMVATEGVRFDSAIDGKKNAIPVFIGEMGGEFNPVEGLEEADYTISVSVYFPLRFKTAFHKLEEYLARCLVGRFMTWGSQKARTNISPAQYGEIEELDTKQLEKWVESIYRKKIEVSEKWCSMTFNLYVSTAKSLGAANGYIMGDQFSATLTYKSKTTTAEFIESSEKMSVETESQQILGTKFVRSIGGTSQYFLTMDIYLKDDDFGRQLISDIIKRQCQNNAITVSKTVRLSSNITDSRDYTIIGADLSYDKGGLMTANLTLGDL